LQLSQELEAKQTLPSSARWPRRIPISLADLIEGETNLLELIAILDASIRPRAMVPSHGRRPLARIRAHQDGLSRQPAERPQGPRQKCPSAPWSARGRRGDCARSGPRNRGERRKITRPVARRVAEGDGRRHKAPEAAIIAPSNRGE